MDIFKTLIVQANQVELAREVGASYGAGGATLPFDGRLYSLIVRGAESTAAQIANSETYVNTKTKAY